MSHLFKVIFSKIFIAALMLLLQIVAIFVVVLYFNYYFLAFQIISAVLGILVFLFIINKKEPAEFKIPWIFLILVLPIFGVTLYVLFGSVRMSGKKSKQLRKNLENAAPFFVTDEKRVEEELGEYVGLRNYIKSNAYSIGSFSNHVEYFKIGEDFFEDLVKELEKAEKYIFMEYFLIFHGKMWSTIHDILVKKVKEGVEVKVMYDDIGTFGMLKSSYWKTLRNEGIDCHKFNPFMPVISGVYNNRDHRKITVIDGKVGYTGGINIGDEYINEKVRFGHWKDTAIKICGREVNALTCTFLSLFMLNTEEEINFAEYLNAESEEFEEKGFVQFFGDGPKPIYQELINENNFMNMIYAAKKSVIITTPYLIIDHQMENALRSAAMRGVEVTIVTPHIPDKKLIFNMTRSNYEYLLQAGVNIYEYTPGFIHAKSVLVDDKIAFVGTVNFDYRSLVHHFECGALMIDVPCVEDIKADMQQVLSVSEKIPTSFCLKGFKKLTAAVVQLFTPML